MTAQDDPYVRVYYRSLSDDKFRDIDSATYGDWVKLLIAADAMHPSPAPLPRWLSQVSLDRLVAATIVDLEPNDCYRIHGLKAERDARSKQGRDAANTRWHGGPDAPAMRPQSASNADPMHSAPLHSDPIRSSPARGIKMPTTNGSGLSKDEQAIVRAHGVLSDKASTDEQRAAARTILAASGIPESRESHAVTNGAAKAPPLDEESITRYRAIRDDATEPDWKREAAIAQLGFMGVTDAS